MTKYSTFAIACGLSDVAGWLENEGWIPKHIRQIRAGAQRLLDLEARARPLSEWTEEDGDVLWWRFPIEEPPYCGSPLDTGKTIRVVIDGTSDGPSGSSYQVGGWPGYHTHWTRFDVPDEGRAQAIEAEGQDAEGGLVHESAVGEADAPPSPHPDTLTKAGGPSDA